MQIGRKALLLLRQMTPSSRQPLVDWIKSTNDTVLTYTMKTSLN